METTATESPEAPTATEVPPRPPLIQSEWVKRFLLILIEPRAYLIALYLLIAFPLGLTYFVFLVAGAVTGAFLSAVLVGILILVAVMVAAWGFALLERDLAIWLLGVEIPPLSLPNAEVVSTWQMLGRHLRQATTWRSLAYLLVKLPFGVFATGITVALLGPPIVGILVPATRILSDGPTPSTIGLLIFPGMFAIVGLALALHILGAIGRAWGRFASDMLGVGVAERQVWEARRRAEAADRSRRELIMNVSHELRTPIASIQAHVDSLLLPASDRPDAEETERRLKVTSAETRRLADLIEDLLMLARADADDIKVTIREVEIGPIVEQVAMTMQPLARDERKVTVNYELASEAVWALADPDRLTQVLTNLVRNAVNYTPQGGVVSIRVPAGSGAHVQVAVSDTGVGISAADLEHIFERFYRADSSRSRNTGGFGLGLAIARELVEAMGGSMSATSQVALGSTFWISLRRAEPR
ncbi:MAG TPA: ATP-binding protein [Candidatus Dormibacteraeota bacterium]|nr:ATP-binding protein [Candidatus Dormibacteraeota bacterium]